MTTAAISYPLSGTPPIGNSSGFIEVADNDTLYRPIVPVGTVMAYNHPVYGSGTAIRLAVPVNTTAITTGQLAIAAAATNAGILSNYSYVICPVTASQNKPVYIALNAIPNNTTAVQYAWFGVTGTSPVRSIVSTAITDKLHISGTAGTVFVTATLGRILIGLTPVVASTATFTVANVRTQAGSPNLGVTSSDGMFVGQSVSGTGITTSNITAISPDGYTVTLASNSTITGSTTATVTMNGGGALHYPICQYSNGITAQFLAT